MTTYTDFYVVGAVTLIVGLLCEWRSEELTGRRVLARALTPAGLVMLGTTLLYQIVNHIR